MNGYIFVAVNLFSMVLVLIVKEEGRLALVYDVLALAYLLIGMRRQQ